MTAMDLLRMQFLQKLHADQGTPNRLNLKGFEREFLASFAMADRPSLWFTVNRNRVTDKLWMKYGDAIGLRHPDLGPVFKPKAKR